MPSATDSRPTHWIRPLPERLINKIAAGEVVERPASVVKELVENSLDAGASRIEVVVEKAGSKLIRVVDDGCGISEDQIEIAFSRHATSKISDFRDLDSITSYGFRGEALPSIASVSLTRMISRQVDVEIGTEVVYEGGVLQSKQPVPASPGTVIEVENIFFNTPARRKFLKAETTEVRHISRTLTALAIGRYEVGFAYKVNERQLFAEPSGSGLQERVSSLLAQGRQLIPVVGRSGPVRIEGYIGRPDHVQSNRSGQYIFINGRFVYSATLLHAFVAGYGDLIPRGNFPVGAVLITVDPGEVDVNVHPSKTEVRLSREREIHEAVRHLIKESLLQDGIAPTGRVSGAGLSTHLIESPATDRARQAASTPHRIPGVTELAATNQEFLSRLYEPPTETSPTTQSSIGRVDTGTGEIIDTSSKEPFVTAEQPPPDKATAALPVRLVGRFADLYLLFQREKELLIVDQHAAHERVLFEQILRGLDSRGMSSQRLLLPEQVELTPEQLALFEETEELLNKSGFGVGHFGGRTVNIEAVPSIISGKSPEQSVLHVLDDIASLRKAGHDLKKAMAQSLACRSAVMGGDRLNDQEALALLRDLLECENMYSCPHGRPTFIKMSRADLDRQFGRG